MAHGNPYPDLQPCPCCGSEATMQQTGRDKLKIQCKGCAIKHEQRCWRYSLEWLEKKMADTWNRRAPPEGMALVPREITAETGHKAGMIGDFSETVTMQCEICEGVGTIDERLGGEAFSDPAATCPDCEGAGEYGLKVPVSWTTIKAIHDRIVEIAEETGHA